MYNVKKLIVQNFTLLQLFLYSVKNKFYRILLLFLLLFMYNVKKEYYRILQIFHV